MLRGGLAGAAVFDLAGGVDPRDEYLAVAFNHLGDAEAFDDVGADAENLHGSLQRKHADARSAGDGYG